MTVSQVKPLPRRARPPAPAAAEFAADALSLEHAPPSPLPRVVMYVVLALFAVLLVWAALGRLDIIAVAPGKLVPATYVKVVQPADSGIIKDILVREGSRVKAGQVLVRLDASIAQAEQKQLLNALQVRRLQVRRIDAELTETEPRKLSGDPAELYTQMLAQYGSHRQAYLDAVGAEQAVMSRAEQDLKSAHEVEDKLKQTLPIFQDQERSWTQLQKEGFAGRLKVLEAQRQRIEVEQELKAQTHAIEGNRAAIAQSSKRVAQLQSNYRQQLHNERAEAAGDAVRLEQEVRKHARRDELLELKAPQDGVIKDLATHTEGAVLSPGTVLMTLVPVSETLRAEVWVSNDDVGFVHEGQPVKLKVGPYPFQKYGMIDGIVRNVSADAADGANQRDQAQSGERGSQASLYRALIELHAQELTADGARHDLSPGMQVSAEIKLGDRTVLEYLLSPVRKAFQEAGRER